jgi:RNA polymerase primary sigma factor
MIVRLLDFQNAKRERAALFPYSRRAMPTRTKREVYRHYRGGESAEVLARRFGLSRSCTDQIINDLDVARTMELPLDHIGNEEFARLCSEKKDREILRALPENDPPARKPQAPGGLPAYLASLYEVPLLTREQESRLFRKMNYLKYKASVLRGKIGPGRSNIRLVRQIGKLYDESIAVKTQIVSANLRLVVSIAKRYVRPTHDLFELVSDGNVSLLRAVDKFDFSRGNKFSTYATWAIMKNFARTFQDAARYRERFSTGHLEILDSEDMRSNEYEEKSSQVERESQVKSILEGLDERERLIVRAHFGLCSGHEPLTLTQIGVVIGVTKERVRQLQVRAMDKMRAAAGDSRVECLA